MSIGVSFYVGIQPWNGKRQRFVAFNAVQKFIHVFDSAIPEGESKSDYEVLCKSRAG